MIPRPVAVKLALVALALPAIACQPQPVCEKHPARPECLPKVEVAGLPSRIPWPPTSPQVIPAPPGLNPAVHKLQLDLRFATDPLSDCSADASAPSSMGTVEIPVRVAEGRLPGPAEWVLRACNVAAGESPEIVRAAVSVYVPPQFEQARQVVDTQPGPGTSVVEYRGVALAPGRIYAYETIRTMTPARRLRLLSPEGAPIILANDEFFTVEDNRQVVVSGGAGLFPLIPAAMGSPSIDVKLAPFAPLVGWFSQTLPSDGKLLAADAGGDRLALVQAKQISLYAMTPDNKSLSESLGACPLDSSMQLLAVAIARGSPHPPAKATESSASTVTRSIQATAVVLGMTSGQPRVVACNETLVSAPGANDRSVVAVDDQAQSCFQQALSKAAQPPTHIALADLDADGLLDLVAAPAAQSQRLFYVPGEIRGSDCGLVEIPVGQPSSTLQGLAVGATGGTRLVGSDPKSPVIPDLALADPNGITYLKRRSPTQL